MVVGIFFVYIAIVVVLSMKGHSKCKSAEDLLVAGWDMPLGLCTWSLIAALMSAPFYYAAVGSGYFKGGWEAFATMGGLASCMILGAFIWVKPIRRLKGWTIGDYYGLRFADKKLGSFCGGIMAIAFGVMNGGALCVGGAYIVQTIFDIPFWVALLIFVAVTAWNATLGGLWSVAYADLFTGAASVLGIISISAIVMFTSQGHIFNHEWWDIGKLFSKGGVEFWVLYLTLAIGDIPAADLGQRACGARSPKVGQKSMVIAGIVVLAMSWTPGMLGEAFKTIYPGVDNAEPLALRYAMEYMNPFVGGVILVAMFGMAMSTTSGTIVAASGVVVKNLYLDLLKKRPGIKSLLRFSRGSILAFCLLSTLLASLFGQILTLAYLAWDLIFVLITWPLIIPPFWKGASAKGVWISITVGIVSYASTSIWGVPGVDEGGLIWMVFQVPSFFSALASLIAFIVGSLIFKPTEEALQAHAVETDKALDDIRTLPGDAEIVS